MNVCAERTCNTNHTSVKALSFYLACGFEVSPDWLGWDREWLLLTKRVSVKKSSGLLALAKPAMIPINMPGALGSKES